MAEVAARLGVSISTVSRALAGNPRISEATRRRVREMTASLGYRVDASASNLRTGLTRTIAVVIPLAHATGQRLSDPFFLEIIGAIGDELALRGYSMLLSKVTQPPGEWISGTIRARRADGVIVIGQSLHHEQLNKAASGEVAMAVWGARLRGQRYVTVGSDNQGGAYLVTSHLISQGCRRIAFLGDSSDVSRGPTNGRRYNDCAHRDGRQQKLQPVPQGVALVACPTPAGAIAAGDRDEPGRGQRAERQRMAARHGAA